MKKRKLESKESTLKKKKKKILFIALFAMIASVVGFFLLYHSNIVNWNAAESVKQYEPSFVKQGELKFIKKGSNNISKEIDIEIADNDEKRTQGLMWRRTMEDNKGMLFIFDDETLLSFWMKNTYMSLDILFVNKSREIVTIWNNTNPLSNKDLSSDRPAQFVVEVNAGFCYTYKIETGDKIEFEINK